MTKEQALAHLRQGPGHKIRVNEPLDIESVNLINEILSVGGYECIVQKVR